MTDARRALSAFIALTVLGCGRDTVAPTPAKRALAISPSPIAMEFHGQMPFRVTDATDTSRLYLVDDLVLRTFDQNLVMLNGFMAVASYPGTTVIEALLRSDTTVRGRTTATVRPVRLLINGPDRVALNANVEFNAASTGTTSIRATWSSSDTSVATVRTVDNTMAVVTGKRLGTTTITATDLDNRSQSGSVVVTVTSQVVTSIEVQPTSVVLRGPRDTVNVYYLVRGQTGTITNPLPTITSRRQLVALTLTNALYRTGIAMQANAAGNDTVIAELGGVRTVIPVTVLPAAPDTATALSTQPTQLTALRNSFADSAAGVVFLPSRNGTITGTHGTSGTYTSAPGFFGVDTVRYTVGRDTGVVMVTVAPGPYSVVPITLDGAELIPASLNDRDEVAGTIKAADGTLRAFRWTAGQVTMLDAPTNAAARSINNLGDVAGTIGMQAVVWFAGTTSPTSLFPASTRSMAPVAINDNRRALVVADPLSGCCDSRPRNFLWSTTRVDTVSALGPDAANDLNNRDQILGKTYFEYPDWFLVPSLGLSYAGCFLGRQSHAIAVNDSSFVLGQTEVLGSSIGGGLGRNFCLWRPNGRTTNLTVESRNRVKSVVSLNDRGWALFIQSDLSGNQGLLYISGGYASLGDLMQSKSAPWTITGFTAMNNRGTILATAIDKSTGQQTSVLLVPQVAPAGHP